MINVAFKTRKVRFRGAGFTLVEAAISIVLVSVLLVAALNTVGAAKIGQQKTAERGRAFLLAQELLSEIVRQEYADLEDVGLIDLRDPLLPTIAIGPDSGESSTIRIDFDDVDDYADWNASPPQNKDGTLIPNLAGWRRLVTVERRRLDDSSQFTGDEKGLKLVTVHVEHNGALIAQLCALKGAGLPAPSPEPSLLFVVTDDTNPIASELGRQALIESWGFGVQLISDNDTQANFDAAAAEVDVAYISVEIAPSELGTKLTTATIGVVNANAVLISDLGYASGALFYVNLSVADVVDNTHYITSTFAMGTLTLSTSAQRFVEVVSGLASGAQVLATIDNGKSSLLVFETGAQLVGGTPAPGRRVQLLWGDPSFDSNALTVDAQTIMKRAIEWAAGMETP